jgi:hypothetical protein
MDRIKIKMELPDSNISENIIYFFHLVHPYILLFIFQFKLRSLFLNTAPRSEPLSKFFLISCRFCLSGSK